MAGSEIKAWRKSRSWSQQKLAAALGVDQATVSRIENNVRSPEGPVRILLDRLLAEPEQDKGERAA